MKPIYLLALLFIAIISNAQPPRPGQKDITKVINNAIVKNDKKENPQMPTFTTPIPTDEPKSPAKGQIKTFWKYIEKMRTHTKQDNMQVVYSGGLQNARMSLSNAKMKDANYNTAEMEQALKECQDVYDKLDNTRYATRDTRVATINSSQVLFDKPFIFENAELKIAGDAINKQGVILNALKISDASIDEYTRQIDEFLASKPEKAMYQNDQKTVAIIASKSEGVIKQVADEYKNGRSLANVSVLQNLYIYKAFIENVKKVFTTEGSLNTYLGKVNAAIAQYGSREGFIAKMAANQAEFIKNLRMAKSVMSNPALEKSAKQQYENISMSNQQYTVSKVNIASDWKLTKNELGIPLYKELYINLAIKFADQTCGLANAWMRQEYEGGGNYSGAKLTMPGSIQQLPCENLK
jgi:hypothetical protein